MVIVIVRTVIVIVIGSINRHADICRSQALNTCFNTNYTHNCNTTSSYAVTASGGEGAAFHRHRLNGYLAQRIPSLVLASGFRMCLNCEVLKGMFPWRTVPIELGTRLAGAEIVHYEYMALAKHTSVSREATLCFVVPARSYVNDNTCVPRRVCEHMLKP